MKAMVLLTLLSCIGFLQETTLYAGGLSGGGGNALLCDDHYYSHDYFITQGGSGLIDPAFDNGQSAKVILSSIAGFLKIHSNASLREMGTRLELFTADIDAKLSEQKANRVWIQGDIPLSRIPDESKLRDPDPKLCNGKVKINQAVVRLVTDKGIVQYQYNPSLLKALQTTSPLQLSFLYVHEFLRDFTENTTVIADMDRLLHTIEWRQWKSEELLTAFKLLGFDINARTNVEAAPHAQGTMINSATLDCTVAGVRRTVEFRPLETVTLSMRNSAGEGLVVDANYEGVELGSVGTPMFTGRRTFNQIGNYTDMIGNWSPEVKQSLTYRDFAGNTRTASCKIKKNVKFSKPEELVAPLAVRKIELSVPVP